MQRHERMRHPILLAIAMTIAGAVHAQALWKYTDKDGKVTYSDKAPKKGESAQLVPNDPAANVIEAPRSVQKGESRRPREGESRGSERESLRDKLRSAIDVAREQLETAKAQLEKGRDPLPSEVQIVVGRSSTGAPTGANSQVRKPEYYARITSLEDAVKQAETKVEAAEQEFRRNAP